MIDREKIHAVARDIQLPRPVVLGWHELERIYGLKLVEPKKREQAARYNFFRAIIMFGGTDHDIEMLIDEEIIEESDWQVWQSVVREYAQLGLDYFINS